jgi:hypothetical protein
LSGGRDGLGSLLLRPSDVVIDELIAVVRAQADRIAVLDTRAAELVAVNEALAAELARMEHLLSRTELVRTSFLLMARG